MQKNSRETLYKLESFIEEFNTLNDELFSIDSIRIEFSKQYKLKPLLELGEWKKISKDKIIFSKLKKRLLNNEITSAYRLKNHNIYYYNRRSKDDKKYRDAVLVVFGMKQYHKSPPPRNIIVKVLSLLRNVTSVDICLDMPYKPNTAKLKQLYTLTPYRTEKGIRTDTIYINKTDIPMLDKIVIYNKQKKNDLCFSIWRIEATIEIPDIKFLAMPLYEFKEIIDLMRDKQALQIAKEIQK
jgi:hypothetical protein